jgi:formylglycine-generating enzyme required for sulfatase activity
MSTPSYGNPHSNQQQAGSSEEPDPRPYRKRHPHAQRQPSKGRPAPHAARPFAFQDSPLPRFNAEQARQSLLVQMSAMQQQMETLNRQLKEQASPGMRRVVEAGHDLLNNVIITGDDVNYYGTVESLNIQSAVFTAPPTPGYVTPRELLWTYLNQVVLDCDTLDLAGIDRKMAGEGESTRLQLAAVYTALDTVHTVPMNRQKLAQGGHRDFMEMAERERQSALAFVNAQPYAALLGDPGSGKTTFANFLTLCLAGEILGLTHANLKQLGGGWTQGALLPVRAVLRTFAAQAPDQTQHSPGDLLWEHLMRQMGQSLRDFAPVLRQHLLAEGGLLILDGLDEVPEAQQRREFVKGAVLDFRRQFPRLRILLTSRTYAYQRQEWRLPGFAEAVLAPFRPEQVESFVNKWYAHMGQMRKGLTADEAQGRGAILKRAIRHNPHLRGLATRPLLLTLMASLHAWRGGSLPDDREQLYEESVELLLDIWERPKIVHDRDGRTVLQSESMAEWLRAPQSTVRKALEALAYSVHAGQRETVGAADIAEVDLVAALLRATNDPDIRPARVVEYIRDRAGLLTNQGEGVYSLPHRTFQEYLAARHLTETGFPHLLAQLVREDTERWREVFLLAAAKVARGTPYAAWSLVAKLCPQPWSPSAPPATTNSDWWAALLAGQALVETEVFRGLHPETDRDHAQVLAAVRSWLQALLEGGQLSAVDRALAGRTLGVLGDERPGVGLCDGRPHLAWATVEAGPFLMGSNKSQDRYAVDNEGPQFVCTLIDRPYRISRYPITVAQYNAFQLAGGYEQSHYWTAAGWQWRQEYRITGPNGYAGAFTAPNHPQVGVSWYEAVAFCAWLSEQLGHLVRLPTEAEWERAARHTDGRLYPWGDVFTPSCCNLNDSGIGSTTAVGSFPAGNAACGAADLAGNVWEWCSTKWLPTYANYASRADDQLAGTERRVLRGGAFYNSRNLLRCATRNFYALPANRYSSIGFRVVNPTASET